MYSLHKNICKMVSIILRYRSRQSCSFRYASASRIYASAFAGSTDRQSALSFHAQPDKIKDSGLSTSFGMTFPVLPDRPAVSKHNGSDQPCLCLCFGFSQITRITPLRFTTLHFSHMGLTDALTFTMYAPFCCHENSYGVIKSA